MFSPWKLESLIPAALRANPVPPPPLVPYTLAHIIAWLETKNPSESYDWNDGSCCLLAQYGRALGLPEAALDATGNYRSRYYQARERMMHAPGYRDGFVAEIAKSAPTTFGAALSRARALEAAR